MIAFRPRALVALPLAAEADPNSTPPADNKIVVLEDRIPGSNLHAKGHLVSPVFNVEEAATAGFTVWVRDAGTGKWIKVSTNAAVGHRTFIKNIGTMSGDVFVQLTAAAPIAATKLTIYVAETAG